MFDEKKNLSLNLGLDDVIHKPLRLNWVSPGKFIMGSPPEEPGRSNYDDEYSFDIFITKGFWLSQFLITNIQWFRVMESIPYSLTDENINNPITNINWFEATAFCVKLNQMFKNDLPKGYRFRLPTEAQWEYACRAGTHTVYYNSDFIDDLDKIAWHKENSAGQVHSVGQKEPNAWMFYDMIGNVAEWCYDDMQPYPKEPTADLVGLNNTSSIQMKIIRGGMWTAPPSDGSFRCSCRMAFLPEKGLSHIGFRVSVRIPEKSEMIK